MIVTLAWKEVREHRSIWLTMAVMTVVLGVGLSRIVAAGNAATAAVVGALSILGLAATYGVVCGAMMLAGEHEGGTLVFLDIFSGRRGLLWLGKLLVGVVLVLTQALTVAATLQQLNQEPPAWGVALVGLDHPTRIGDVLVRGPVPIEGLNLWFLILPVVTLEAYAWGLLGSALTRRVLAGAAVAAVAAVPVWISALCAPPHVFLGVRLVGALVAVIASVTIFYNQAREAPLGPPPPPEELPEPPDPPDPRRRFLERYDSLEEEEDYPELSPVGADDIPVVMPVAAPRVVGNGWGDHAADSIGRRTASATVPRAHPRGRRLREEQASSPREALWWLTFQQAWALCTILAVVSLVVGCFVPSQVQILWPVATLLLGVACGTATFAPEQRDLAYQFLAAQHLPLPVIWRFRIVFWLGATMLLSLCLVAGAWLIVFVRQVILRLPTPFQLGTLPELLGPVLFFNAPLAYGFAAAQLMVWLCRKSILAVLLAALAAVAAFALWLPSLLCRGLNGWQVWVPPLLLLLATNRLVRAWAGGRIKERKPTAALAGFGLAILAWAAINFAYRAWEVPVVGEPFDAAAFRASIPSGAADVAGKRIQEAIAALENEPAKEGLWLDRLATAGDLPPGVIETPHSDGQASALRHLPTCVRMTERLRTLARAERTDDRPGPAFDHLARILTLSRSLRNKAPVASYLAGVRAEESALEGVDEWLAAGPLPAAELRRALEELNRHVAATPPPADSLRTECFRAGGALENPVLWSFARPAPGQRGAIRIPERWLTGGIALALETPWEAERKTRLWQAVWAGMFRTIETPFWELPERAGDIESVSATTQQILQGWLPADDGLSRAELARLLDASWLADERLFAPVVQLRAAATRSRWRVEAARQVVALTLFQVETGRPAEKLADLVPKYLDPRPVDPYSGEPFHYRIAQAERIEGIRGAIHPGQGILWSTGPDRTDHGGHKQGDALADDDPQWTRGAFDLIAVTPHWP